LFFNESIIKAPIKIKGKTKRVKTIETTKILRIDKTKKRKASKGVALANSGLIPIFSEAKPLSQGVKYKNKSKKKKTKKEAIRTDLRKSKENFF